MFFSIDNESVAEDVDFLEKYGTLYDLLIYLLDNPMRIIISAEDQIKFLSNNCIKRNILSMKTDIKDQSEEKKKKIFAKQEILWCT